MAGKQLEVASYIQENIFKQGGKGMTTLKTVSRQERKRQAVNMSGDAARTGILMKKEIQIIEKQKL